MPCSPSSLSLSLSLATAAAVVLVVVVVFLFLTRRAIVLTMSSRLNPFHCFGRCCIAASRCGGGGGGDVEKGGPKSARVADDKGAEAARRFGWGEIETANGDLASAVVIGEGGFSMVYLAHLPCDSSPAALKLLPRSTERLHRAFRQELDVLLRTRHPHIVRLLGYCDEREEGVLVLEYISNGSLREKLHGKDATPLRWGDRMRIAYQVATAVEYLHEGCDLPIVHGDITASNVLLDADLEPRLCDFGSAQVGFSASVCPPSDPSAQRGHRRHNMMMGSPGYADPHYLRTGIVSKKSDVYSFGVLLLEMLTGTEPFSEETGRMLTPALVSKLGGDNDVVDVVDRRLGGKNNAGEAAAVAALALLCTGEQPSLRPSMADVIRILAEKVPSTLISAVGSKSNGKAAS